METTEIIMLIDKITALEKEELFLCDHESFRAAEKVGARKCAVIDRLKNLVTPEQSAEIDQIQASAFLAYLAKGIDYTGPYPSATDAICRVLHIHHRIPLVDAAAALGRIKSDRKAASSRENGKKGGRPRKEVKP